MNYKRNMEPQMVAQGWHFATITEIKEGKPAQTKWGQSDTALTTFKTDNHCMVTQSFLMAPGVNFTLEKLIDIVFEEGDDQVDLEELVGKRCGIKVEHKFWNDRVFANVVDVCSVYELQEDDSSTPPVQELNDIEELDLN
ncbi:hypothetical protein [Cytobacillus firmus]|uniref:hypothetical protein n=1 Tax=Cytobacillus firmus TaxID=1399 RepID=UPI0018CDC3AE|nr:hypothetical protein [Cytobacillus firmus]MBG9654086.1 hypothetical protein [Cytobacillus firmus]MED1908593.1 hypothetical protein [Cytobacillus firmus]